MAGLEPYNSKDDVSRSQVVRRRVLLLLGPLVTPFIARWWWIEFGDPATPNLLLSLQRFSRDMDPNFNFKTLISNLIAVKQDQV